MKGTYLWTTEHGLVKVRRPLLTWLFGLSIALVLGMIGGYALSAYQHGVDHELSAAKWQQFEVLKTDYEERFKKHLRVSKPLAQVIAAEKERERAQRGER